MKFQYLALVFMLFISASGQNSEIKQRIRFPLDKTTGFNASTIQYDELNKQISIFYPDQLKLLTYCVENQKFVNEIRFQKEGPDGVGVSIDGHLIDNNFIYLHSYFERKLFKLNMEGKVVSIYDLILSDNENLIVQVTTMQPMVIFQNCLLLSGHLYQTLPVHKIGSPIISLNLETNEINSLLNYPDKTYSGNWAGIHSTSMSVVSDDMIAIDFSIHEDILLTNIDQCKYQIKLKSSYISEPIIPISNDYDYDVTLNRQKFSNYVLSSRYYGLKYNQYKKILYRFVIIGRTYEEFKKLKSPKFSIIITDNNLSKIGETVLPPGYYPKLSFITSDGIYIANKKYYDTVSDDFLTFDLFDI